MTADDLQMACACVGTLGKLVYDVQLYAADIAYVSQMS